MTILYMKFYYNLSNKTKIKNHKSGEKIYLIYQYFLHKDPERQKEIEFCLKKNSENKHIHKIYLLNERIYSKNELGNPNMDKIIQINHKTRLKYKDVFSFVASQKLDGYIVFLNADIFLDDTIQNILKTDTNEKKTHCQLRFEYNASKNINSCLVFNKNGKPRRDSQDTWIYHSKYNIKKQKDLNLFDFYFGKPGCDNIFTYLMSSLGFKIYNDPYFIKTYHFHTTNIRDYTERSWLRLPYPYILIEPYISMENIRKFKYNKDFNNTEGNNYLTSKKAKKPFFNMFN